MRLNLIGIRVFVGLALMVTSANGQAPAGPVTQNPAPPSTTPAQTTSTQAKPDAPRTRNFTGSWKLNKDESTQPRKRDDDSSGRRGGRSGGGWPGGGRGGYGGGMHRGMSDDQRKEMQELMRPSETLDFPKMAQRSK